MNKRRLKLTKYQIKIIELLCLDYGQKNIASETITSLSKVEKELKYLRSIFEVRTNNGLVYKYTISRLGSL
jgi:hypothetical protein